MKLTVIVPVLNEEETLKPVIERLSAARVKCEKEIIIVDDGSTDRSPEIIRDLKEKNPEMIKTVRREKRCGKGNAIKEALPLISGDIVIIQDADMEYDIGDYPALLEPIISGSADVVFGSRFLGTIKKMRPQNLLANKILTFLANLLYGLKITDEATAYKVFRADVFKKFNIQAEKFEFCPEVVAKAALFRCRIKEVPVSYEARTVKQGKKIKWHDAFSAVWTLVKYRFVKVK